MMTGTTDLADFLVSIGVDVRRTGQEISARCPVHLSRVGKEDNSPSWSMNASTGLWLCYSCGAKGTLHQLVVELTGNTDEQVSQMVMVNNVERLSMPEWERKEEVDIQKYLRFSPVPKRYLNSRNITEEAARYYGVRWNDESNAWILPMVYPDGTLMGWQEKGVGYTRNYPIGVKKSKTLFGIDRLRSKTVVLVESPLDVARFYSSFDGMQCLASFGAMVSREQMRLIHTVADRLIVALDNDDAGIASAKKIFEDMPMLKGGVYWLRYEHTSAKDIGEMSDQEIEEAVATSSVIPWWI